MSMMPLARSALVQHRNSDYAQVLSNHRVLKTRRKTMGMSGVAIVETRSSLPAAKLVHLLETPPTRPPRQPVSPCSVC